MKRRVLDRVATAVVLVTIDLGAWEVPQIFGWLRAQGGVSDAEMLKTFNCGIGMVAAVAADRADEVEGVLEAAGERVVRIGLEAAGDGVRFSGAL